VPQQRLRRDPQPLGHLGGREQLAASTGGHVGQDGGQRVDRGQVGLPRRFFTRLQPRLEGGQAGGQETLGADKVAGARD
jgi:hypothetical protein